MARRTHVIISAQVTVVWPVQTTALSVLEGFGSGRERRTIAGDHPRQHGGSRQTGGGRSPCVDSRCTSSRPSWTVVSRDQRWVEHATIGGGGMVTSVGTQDSSRGLPVPSGTAPQRTSTRASPRRYQCPVPVPTARARVLPPDQATVRVVRVAVAATPACGAARGWPFTRGRPLVPDVRGGGGADTAAAPSNGLTNVR
jgi:hypothetical protein